MRALHTIRARADERGQHKTVDAEVLASAALHQPDTKMPFGTSLGRKAGRRPCTAIRQDAIHAPDIAMV